MRNGDGDEQKMREVGVGPCDEGEKKGGEG